MDTLRDLFSGPGPAPAGLTPGLSPPTASASAPAFAEALFEEGVRAGPPGSSLARQVAALDRQPRTGMGEHLALDLDRRDYALEDSVPERELSLGDLLDVINPLQHIPVVATIYRDLTGDEISGPARVAGAALYGGPAGMLAGVVNAIAEEISGKDLGGALMASVLGENSPEEPLLAAAALPPVKLEPAKGAAPLAASFAPSPQDRPLTGAAAIGALFNDLRAETAIPKGLPGPAPAAQAASFPADDPLLSADAAITRGFTAQMMQGLEKYRALAVDRGGPGRPAPARIDRGL